MFIVTDADVAGSVRCGIQVERRNISPLRGWQHRERATINILPLRGFREFSAHFLRRKVAGGFRLKSGS